MSVPKLPYTHHIYQLSAMPFCLRLIQRRNYSQSAHAPKHFVNSFRQAMTSLASPAVILTTANKDPESGSLRPRGLTVSSFNSLSIKPWPLITFNIQVPSHAANSMRNVDASISAHKMSTNSITTPKLFAVNILPATLEAAKACRAFAGGLGPTVNPFTHPSIQNSISFSGLDQQHLEFNDQPFTSHEHEKNENKCDNSHDNNANMDQSLLESYIREIPVFAKAKAVLYCTQQAAIPVADHEIWIAKVLHVDVQKDDVDSSSPLDTATLVYHSRKFHKVGTEIEK